MQTLPIITKRTHIDVQGINGQPIFSYYQQLMGLLKKEGSDEGVQNVFAEPVSDVLRGEVSWVTKLDGLIRPFDDLSPEEKLAAAKKLTQICDAVRRVADKVGGGSGSSAAYASQALLAMLSTPDALASLFMVGDQLVVTQWGCLPYGSSAGEHHIDSRLAQSFKPASKMIAQQQQTARAAAIANVDASATSLNWIGIAQWAFLGLLALLLIAGLFYKQWIAVFNPGPTVETQDALRQRVAELWGKVEKKSADCFPPAPVQAPIHTLPTSPSSSAQQPAPTVSAHEIDRRLQESSVAQGQFINVTLAWKNQADLDLIVVEPGGVAISMYENNVRRSPSGGGLDIDANACQKMSGCASRPDPVENISWNKKPPAGQYDVYVALFSANVPITQREDVPYSVVVTVDGQKTSYEGVIKVQDMVCADRCRSKTRIKVASFTIS